LRICDVSNVFLLIYLNIFIFNVAAPKAKVFVGLTYQFTLYALHCTIQQPSYLPNDLWLFNFFYYFITTLNSSLHHAVVPYQFYGVANSIVNTHFTGHLEKCEGVIQHFWAKNCTKSHYFSKIALLWTIWPKSVILHFWTKIAPFHTFWQKLHFSETKSHFFSNFSHTFPDALIIGPIHYSIWK